MRALVWLLALLLSAPALTQEKEKAPPKKPAAKKQAAKNKPQPAEQPKAHSKPTPEQIRKFNELQKQPKTQ